MTSRLLIKEANIKSATGGPFHYTGQILLPLSSRRQMLMLHKVTNPLILINYFNTANRMRVHRNRGPYILCPRGNSIAFADIVRNQLFQVRRMDFGCKITFGRSVPRAATATANKVCFDRTLCMFNMTTGP
jgi:hypothetical protein